MSNFKFHKWHLIQAGLLFLFSVSVVLVSIPLEKAIRTSMKAAKAQIISSLEATTDHRFSYDSISPSVLSNVAIRNLKIFRDKEKTSELAGFSTVNVYYDFFAFVSGDVRNMIKRVHVSGVDLSFDIEKDRNMVELMQNFELDGNNRNIAALTITGSNVNVSAALGSIDSNVRDLDFTIELTGNKARISIDSIIAAKFKLPELPLKELNTRLTVDGELSSYLDWATVTVGINDFYSNLVSLEDQTFYVGRENLKWEVRKIQDKAPLDIRFVYDEINELLTLDFAVEELRLRQLVRFEKDLSRYSPYHYARMSGNGSINASLDNDRLRYSYEGSLFVPEYDLPWNTFIQTSVRGNEQRISFQRLDIGTDRGSIRFNGWVPYATRNPVGTITVDDFHVYESVALSAELKTDFQNGLYTLEKNGRTRLGELSIDRLEFKALLTDDEVSYDFIVQPQPLPNNNDEDIKNADQPQVKGLFGKGIIDRNHARTYQIEFGINAFSAGQLAKIFTASAMPGRIVSGLDNTVLNGSLFVNSNDNDFSFYSNTITIADSQNDKNSFSVEVNGNNNRVWINNIDASLENGYNASGAFVFVRSPAGPMTARGSIISAGEEYDFKGLVTAEEMLINGSGDLEFHAKYPDGGNGFEFFIKADTVPLPVKSNSDMFSRFSSVITGRFDGLTKYDVVVHSLTLHDMPAGTSNESTIDISARARPGEIMLYSVRYNDVYSDLSGAGRIKTEGLTEEGLLGWIMLASTEQNEEYYLFGSIENNDFDLDIVFQNAPVTRLVRSSVTGNLSGQGHFYGTFEDPRFTINLRLSEGRVNTAPASLEASVELNDDELVVESFSGRYKNHQLRSGAGKIYFGNGVFYLTAQYAGKIKEDPFGFGILLQGELQNNIEQTSDVRQSDFSGALILNSIYKADEQYPDYKINIKKTDGAVSIHSANDKAVSFEINSDGVFTAELRSPLPLRLRSAGTVRKGIMDADINNLHFDLEFLNNFVVSEFISFSQGVLDGELSVRGPVTAPRLGGILFSNNAIATSAFVNAVIGPISLRVSFHEGLIRIHETFVPVKDGGLAFSGELQLDRTSLAGYNILLELKGSRGIPIHYAVNSIDLTGNATGYLSIYGDDVSVNFEGELNAMNSLVALGAASEGNQNTGPPAISTNVDIKITTGERVSFVYPQTTFPILKFFASEGDWINIEVDTDTLAFGLTGEINIKRGDVNYFERTFFLKEGRLLFNEDEKKFNPALELRAELRERIQDEDIRIILTVDGNLSNLFNPRLESFPPMTQQEILAILNPAELLDSDMEGLLVKGTTGLFTQIGLVRPVEEAIREALNLDHFSIRTQLIQEVLYDTIFERDPGGSQIDSTVQRYLDNTSVFVGKSLTDEIYFEGLIGFNLEEYYNDNLENYSSLALETELSLEFETPLFLIDLTMMPEDVQNLFVTDTSISVTWIYRY